VKPEAGENMQNKTVAPDMGAVKGLIIAAGMGNRLNHYTDNLPKCMLQFGDKTLLKHQLDAFDDNGITDISLIRGYKKEKIAYPNIRYYENEDYKNNNILKSLFCAEDEIEGDVIISYSDILFESRIVSRLLESPYDISVVVDVDWKVYYTDRRDHPFGEAEGVIFNADACVKKIGKIYSDKNDINGEFIGMFKLTPRGCEILKANFHEARALYDGKPFQRAEQFNKAYLTDIFQYMADLGVRIHCVTIERGWKEIDTVEDYEKALKGFPKC